jgi:hypothetical protein
MKKHNPATVPKMRWATLGQRIIAAVVANKQAAWT